MRTIDADELIKQKIYSEIRHEYIVPVCEIDNAPTMPLPDFKEGYKQAILDGKTNYSRPTGEWKCFIGSAYYGIDEDGEPIWRERKIYHCPKCNRRTVIKENFCPTCGTDMRGEKEC